MLSVSHAVGFSVMVVADSCLLLTASVHSSVPTFLVYGPRRTER